MIVMICYCCSFRTQIVVLMMNGCLCYLSVLLERQWQCLVDDEVASDDDDVGQQSLLMRVVFLFEEKQKLAA